MNELANNVARMSAIGAVLATLALGAAFAGAGLTAFLVLAVVVGPASFYGNKLLSRPRQPRRQQPQPHA